MNVNKLNDQFVKDLVSSRYDWRRLSLMVMSRDCLMLSTNNKTKSRYLAPL